MGHCANNCLWKIEVSLIMAERYIDLCNNKKSGVSLIVCPFSIIRELCYLLGIITSVIMISWPNNDCGLGFTL